MTARLAIIASVIVAFVFLGTAPGMVFAQETTPGATQEPSDIPPVLPLVEGLRIEPQQVEQGGQASIIVDVVNAGDTQSSLTINLQVDGQVFTTRTIQVPAGGRVAETFTTPPVEPGIHSVQVGDAEARFVVVGPEAAPPQQEQCVLREGMQVRLQNIVSTIQTTQDGHIELSFRNPPVNDCTVVADLRITVPQNIIPIAKEGAISGTAATLNAFVEALQGAERALKLDFKGQEVGEYFINFSGTYWPKGNKDLLQPITLPQKLIVESPSDPESIPADTGISPVPAPQESAAAEGGSTATETNQSLIESNFPLWIIALIIVVLVVLVVIVAIVALGKRGGGGRTTIIQD